MEIQDKHNAPRGTIVRLLDPRAWWISVLDLVAIAGFGWTGVVLIVVAVQTTDQTKLLSHYPLSIEISAALHCAAAAICILRTRRPLVFSGLAAAILLGYVVLQWNSGQWLGFPTLMMLGPLAVGTLAWRESNLWLTVAFMTACVGAVFSPSVMISANPLIEWATHVLVLLVALLIGRLIKTNALRAENYRRQLAAQAVSSERERIASDLHDEVGHGLTVVIAQARAATLMSETDPAMVKLALERITQVASQTLSATRQTVGALREDVTLEQGHIDTAGIRMILENMMESKEIRLTAMGPIQVEEATSGWVSINRIALKRVLIEGCTNALKHGSESEPIAIRIDASEVCAEIEIANAIKTAPPRYAPGVGLVFLRTRVHAVGGEIASTSLDGRFTLHATIPSGRGE